MVRSNPGEWRRALKALVAALNPEVGLLIGREDASGHHPVRLTLDGCRETLRLYDDQVVALTEDPAVRSAVQREIEESLLVLRLKAEILRAAHRAQPTARLRLVGPRVYPEGEVGVAIQGAAGPLALEGRAGTYLEALRRLHDRVVAASAAGRP